MKKIFSYIIILTSIGFSNYIHTQTYIEQNSGVTTGLTSVSIVQFPFYNPSAWICGYSGVVLKTTNFGTNWLNKSGNGLPSSTDLYNIFCIDTTIALTAGISGSGTYVYRTSNGGNSWQQVFDQSNGFIDAIWMKTALVGFMYGDPVGGRWSLWKTSNGGVNWDSSGMNLLTTVSEAGWNNALFIRNNNIWFGTNNHKIYRSTNFGINWTAGTVTELNSTAIWFYYADSLYGYYGGNNVYKTTDGGASWTIMTCPGTGSFLGFVSGTPGVNNSTIPPMINWTVRGDNKIYFNFDMSNWNADYTSPAGNYLHIGVDYMYPLMYTWAVRSNGGITRIPTAWGEVKKLSSALPGKFSLSQNYPNPFNPKSKIEFQIAKLGPVQIVIYDISGREITKLINEQLQPGIYETEWDASSYPSGVYFYKLITSDYTETRKMVLIK